MPSFFIPPNLNETLIPSKSLYLVNCGDCMMPYLVHAVGLIKYIEYQNGVDSDIIRY